MFEFQSTSHIEKNAEELRAELKKIIVHAFVEYGGAIAIDGWTDKFKKNSFSVLQSIISLLMVANLS